MSKGLEFSMFEGKNMREERKKLEKEKLKVRQKFRNRFKRKLQGSNTMLKIEKKSQYKKIPKFSPKISVFDFHLCPDELTFQRLEVKKQRQDFNSKYDLYTEEKDEMTSKENKKLENLKNSTFFNWTKRDQEKMVNGSMEHGICNYPKIKDGIRNKTEEEVKKYTQKFWQKILTFRRANIYFPKIIKAEIRRLYWIRAEEILNEMFNDQESQIFDSFKMPTLFDMSKSKHLKKSKKSSNTAYTAQGDKILLFWAWKLKFDFTLVIKKFKEIKELEFDIYYKTLDRARLEVRVLSILGGIQELKDLNNKRRKVSTPFPLDLESMEAGNSGQIDRNKFSEAVLTKIDNQIKKSAPTKPKNDEDSKSTRSNGDLRGMLLGKVEFSKKAKDCSNEDRVLKKGKKG